MRTRATTAHRIFAVLILLYAVLGGYKIQQMHTCTLRKAICSLLSVTIGRVDPEAARLEGIAILTLNRQVGMIPRAATLLRDVAEEALKLPD